MKRPESTDSAWEVIVVGAGAAGLLVAAIAAERGRRTLLLEKNRKPGAKILMSGGTRCNITQATDRRGIVEAFGKQGNFLHSALAALSPTDLVAMFEAEGVQTKVEETGKIFPASDKATDVLAALMRKLRRSGCELALGEPVLQLTRQSEGFQLTTPHRVLHANKVVVTTGGQSYPGCGTTGDGYDWLTAIGHTIIPPRPSLTPVTTNEPWIARLRGVTIADVLVRVAAGKSKPPGESPPAQNGNEKTTYLAESRGSFLFTHFGFSGPAVLNVSRAITAFPQPQTLHLECNFLPAVRADELDRLLKRECEREGKKQLVGIIARYVPRRLAEVLLERLGTVNLRAAELSKKMRQQLAAQLQQNCTAISGTRGFKKAEVTAGGVALEEVDSRTMESKLVPNLYLAGEILDLDGPIGGYNFQAAFSEATLAGQHL